jgi:hypothetical protein
VRPLNLWSKPRKNTLGQTIGALCCSLYFVVTGVGGITTERTAVLKRGNGPIHYLLGEQAVLLAVLYLGFATIFLGYVFRFNRFHKVIFALLCLLWLGVSAAILLGR